ncbi:MAG TPA: hypothetical protein DDY52_00970 [Candidatus Moranbacteria bacterium]|nr:MAG: hypothetical protein UR51_C0005G0004 [Candidatus Moranbacteria bacterium GW2011_GWF1_34_10]HBI16718.1 hypothetical protein [Candidatus Moranbacteria bacterium]
MKKISWFAAVVGTVSLISVTVFSIIFWYSFAKNCEDYLKLAGDAPSIEKADKFLGQALSYIEKENLTRGNSAYIFHTPKNDVGIWYEQIKGAKETTLFLLDKIENKPEIVSQLEQDNALMKIREVVLDSSQNGTSVTLPDAITWFPYQWGMFIWWWASIIVSIGGWFFVKRASDGYY